MKRLVAMSLAVSAMAGALFAETAVVFFPFREATMASQVDSTMKPYRFRIGEAFRKGDPVVELDAEKYAIEAGRSKEQRDFLAAVYHDKKELRSKDFASEFEEKKAKFDFSQAEAQLKEAELNVRRCRVSAPFDGKVAEYLTREFETVKPGQPLVRIIEDRRLLAVANAAPGLYREGGDVEIATAGTTCRGKVYDVAPQADNRTGTVRVRFLVDNSDGRFASGQTGELK